MTSLVHAEVLKLPCHAVHRMAAARDTRHRGVDGGLQHPEEGDQEALVPLDDPGLLAATIGTGLLISQVLVTVFGVMAFTQEYRYGTITSAYLVEPRTAPAPAREAGSGHAGQRFRRGRARSILVVPPSIILIGSRHGEAELGGQFWQVVGVGFAVLAASAAIGVALGAVVRHQIAAVVGVLVWMTAIEHVVIPALPALGRWMPGGATLSVLQQGTGERP